MTKQHIVYCHEIFSACVYNEEKVLQIYIYIYILRCLTCPEIQCGASDTSIRLS